MISHFQWKELKNNLIRKEWEFSFFYKGTSFKGIYFMNGSITWLVTPPTEQEQKTLEGQIHDLMLYHVYEEH